MQHRQVAHQPQQQQPVTRKQPGPLRVAKQPKLNLQLWPFRQ